MCVDCLTSAFGKHLHAVRALNTSEAFEFQADYAAQARGRRMVANQTGWTAADDDDEKTDRMAWKVCGL